MAYINLYDCVGDVMNKERCISELCNNSIQMGMEDGSDAELARKLNSLYSLKSSRYFTSTFREVDKDDVHAYFLWLDTGCTNVSGEKMYAQFSKSAFGWQGCYVGTEDGISIHQIGKTLKTLAKEKEDEGLVNASNEVSSAPEVPEGILPEDCLLDEIDSESDSTSCVEIDSFYTDLLNRLLIQKGWDVSSLKNYISLLISRLNFLLESKRDVSKYLVWNNNKDKALINSALLDKFGRNLLFVSEKHRSTELSYTRLQLVDSKVMLCSRSFDKLALNMDLKRVPFYDNSMAELVFDADINDFDLDNWYRLSHCIIDRRERFPEPWCSCSAEQLCQDVINAVELGLRISKYDSGYVKPFYSKSRNKIQFIIPYHVGNNFQNTPELGILVDKTEYGLWQVITILDYNMCCRNIKALSLYSDNSF